ncbi:MAG: DNA mismatch repair endonuclease MutL [Prevotellaceae bacterium]|jgi:DNA mismatch repair protein MutL|nr:DNA mismatch repair endonuclease MutL [Prevotellaceae bacterium]
MIRVLPDSVANQIAAGEVIQRPASVIKELVENSVDAGSTSINITVKDAGRTLIQVTDNGSGMSDTDARLSFERHATSKISSADDLLKLYTFGFRGEALASIASIAEVELKTRQQEDETGTQILINASTLVSQETVSCPAGSSFSIRNLFFNVPARRKFLKSDNVELKHIMSEFQRVALCNPHIEFTLASNGTAIYKLCKGNIKQRITEMFGKNTGNNLIAVKADTNIVKIEGYIGKPEYTRKTAGEQFFFANNRFFKSAYLQKAVINAYEQLIQSGVYPVFFLYLTVEPENLDVNIHPTKVEIKFSEEQTIWQILNAAVREALGKFALAPKIDFDIENRIDIPVLTPNTKIVMPKLTVDETFNPFETERKSSGFKQEKIDANWQKIYEGAETFEFGKNDDNIPKLFNSPQSLAEKFIQIKDRYIGTNAKSGLMIIDQKRAHQRILFEQFLINLESSDNNIVQQEIFPQTIELSAMDFIIISEHIDNLHKLGFDIRIFGKNTIAVYGLPPNAENTDAENIVHAIIDDLKDETGNFEKKSKERLALALAKVAAIGNKILNAEEMNDIAGKLLACSNPNICPEGKPALTIITLDEIQTRFLK